MRTIQASDIEGSAQSPIPNNLATVLVVTKRYKISKDYQAFMLSLL